MAIEQSFRPTWQTAEDAADQDARFQRARAAVAAVDWAALSDFDSIIAAGRAQRLMGLGTPVRSGGTGLTTRQCCTLFREFERIDTTSAHSVGYYNTLGVLPLLFAGRLDPGGLVEQVAGGQVLASFVLTEPQGGSHMAGMREMARPEGNGWALTGTKTYIAHAQAADHLLVCARTAAGFAVFPVPRDAPGIRIARTFRSAYMRRIFVNEIVFDDVKVSDDQVVHDPKVIYDAMMLARIYILAAKIGHVERCLDHLEPFVASRRISTGAMADNPSVRRRLRQLRLSVGVLEAVLERALRTEQEGGTPYDLAMVAKIVGVALAMDASRTLQALFGARGLDPGSGIPDVADDVRVWTVMEGTAEPMQHFLAANYLKDSGWIGRFAAAHPAWFAAVPRDVAPDALDTDMPALGEAVAWAVTGGCLDDCDAADDEGRWLVQRRCAAAVEDFRGPSRHR